MWDQLPGFKKIHDKWFWEVLEKFNSIKLPEGPPTTLNAEDNAKIDGLMEFWFPPKTWSRHISRSMAAMGTHFAGKKIDQTIRDKFLGLYEEIVSGKLDHWK